MNKIILHPGRRVTKHLRIGSQFMSEEDQLMVPNVDELRFKKIIFDITKKTKEQIQQSVELFVKEIIHAHPDYYYHALRRLKTRNDNAGVFILVMKHKKHEHANQKTNY